MQFLLRLVARPTLAKQIQPSLLPRTFTTLSPLRPTLSPTFRPNIITNFSPAPAPAPATSPASAGTVADLVPKSAVSSHPSLAGAQQLRFGPRNTMNGHTRLVQKRRHGWLKRTRSKTGRRILERRKLKGRRHVAW